MGDWMYRSTYIFTSAQVGDEWSASCSGLFTSEIKIPYTHWVGSRTGLYMGRRESYLLYGDSNCEPSIEQPAASRYID
jgi:hypothetical protein